MTLVRSMFLPLVLLGGFSSFARADAGGNLNQCSHVDGNEHSHAEQVCDNNGRS